MKNKVPRIISIPLVIAVSMLALYLYQRKDVEILSIRHDCKNKPCKVGFVIENKTNNFISCSVSIRALRSSPGSKSSAVSAPGFAGEKIMDIDLFPKETKEIEEVLTLRGSISRIQVNAFNIR